MLKEAIEALKEYDWGTDREPLAPIDDAIAASHGNVPMRQDIERQLLKALDSDISRDAKDFVCRKLAIVGSSASVAVLSKLLRIENHSHMARFALERIPGLEATRALVEALSVVHDKLKVGVISSLGSRHDATAVASLVAVLGSSSDAVAKAAASALGQIGTSDAAKALAAAPSSPAVSDAQLVCAETLLANHRIDEAKKIYRSLSAETLPKLVRLAATRGILACAAKHERTT
jgi:HEAT repeat protein